MYASGLEMNRLNFGLVDFGSVLLPTPTHPPEKR